MSTNKQEENVQDVDLEKVKKWLKHDMASAISCLNAIYSDPDLMDSVAQFLYGRMVNELTKRQSKMEFETNGNGK